MTARARPSVDARPCSACGKPIHANARACRHCGADQRRQSRAKHLLKICAGLGTLLAVVFSVHEGYRIWKEHRTEDAVLRERLSSAQALVEVDDYEAAWQILADATTAQPTSADVRAAQIDVATSWLLDGSSIPDGWLRAGNVVGSTMDPGEVADIVHPQLVVASVLADGEELAALESLVTWANFLRGRVLRTERRDLGPDFRKAQEIAPDALLPNLLLGYWQATFENDPEGATRSWNAALAADGDRLRVRRFQTRTLANGANQSIDGAVAYRRALLLVLDDMERHGDELPRDFAIRDYFQIYATTTLRQVRFDDVADALQPDRHLAVLEWVRSAFDIQPGGFGLEFETFQLIRAHILERAGRTEEALAAISDPEIDVEHAETARQRLNDLHERLTGAPLPDTLTGDKWATHSYFLANAAPGHARFEAAMEALERESTIWQNVGNPLRNGRLPPALDAAITTWDRVLAQPASAAERTRAEETLRFLRFFRGHLRADTWDFAGGIAELESLLKDPGLSPDLRAEALFAVAGAYERRAGYLDEARPITDEERSIHEAYLYEAFDRLAAAIDAGFDDWDRIEHEFTLVRELDDYDAFSLRHGRVPPGQTGG